MHEHKHHHHHAEKGAGGVRYVCPMHPEVVSDSMGKCPKCDMDLLPEHIVKRHEEKHEHKHDHHEHHIMEIKRKAIVTTVLTVPVLYFSESFQSFLGFKAIDIPLKEWISPLLSTVIFIYGGSFFIKGSLDELRSRKPGMMTLIGVAITTAFLYSISTVFFGGKEFFWELTTLIVIMLWGHLIEMKSVLGASRALESLVKLMPTKANLIKNGEVIEIDVFKIKKGDLLLVKPGEKIPVDGEVTEGETHVNEAFLTGESKPVVKKPGDKVIGGSINIDGSIKMRAEKVGEELYLNQVIKLVKEAQESKTRLSNLADRVAFYLTIVAIGTGGITLFVWLLFGKDFQFSIERAVTVMVIACPHALGVAIPLVVAVSTSYSARNGILIRNRLALETAKDIDAVLFDKTGTLTEGKFGVTEIIAKDGVDKDYLLKLASSLEIRSEHVIARTIVEFAKEKGVEILEVSEFKAVAGKGIVGTVDGKRVGVGTLKLIEELGIPKNNKLIDIAEEFERNGNTVVFVSIDESLAGFIALSDRIRKESFEAVRELKEMGKRVFMITGDAEEVARKVAKDLGIDDFFARVLPHQKSEKVKELQERGLKVAMVGDGINDAPALVQADIGIAIGSGTDVAIESADIILVGNDPRQIPRIIRLSSLTYKKMIQNLFWAVGYNVFAIPLAAGILAPVGIILKPAVGAILMSASTVIVSINALLLKTKLT